MMATATYSPRIYVASLSDYNAGRLHGAWIDATDADDMREEIAKMLRASKYPNVEVDCPDCYGTGQRIDHIADTITPCETCKTTGNVPSAEEWAIHDYDDWGSIKLGEYEDLEHVAAVAALLEEHGEPFAVWFNHMDADAYEDDELGDSFEAQYLGEFSNAAEYAEHYIGETGLLADVPDTLARYFDYEAFGRDMELGGDISIVDGYAFDNNA